MEGVRWIMGPKVFLNQQQVFLGFNLETMTIINMANELTKLKEKLVAS